MTAQADTTFYKAVCGNQAYTYVRRLNKCIRRSAEKRQFAGARALCEADGGNLLMVKNNDVRLYLRDIMLSVTDTSKYWIGATQDAGNNSLWHWVDGTQMTDETGWSFWDVDNPSSNFKSVHMIIVAEHGDVVFNDVIKTREAGVLCELSP